MIASSALIPSNAIGRPKPAACLPLWVGGPGCAPHLDKTPPPKQSQCPPLAPYIVIFMSSMLFCELSERRCLGGEVSTTVFKESGQKRRMATALRLQYRRSTVQ